MNFLNIEGTRHKIKVIIKVYCADILNMKFQNVQLLRSVETGKARHESESSSVSDV